MGKEVGHIEPDAARSDEGHTLSDFYLAPEHGVVGNRMGQVAVWLGIRGRTPHTTRRP